MARRPVRERFKLYEQELGQKVWMIVQLFYRSLLVFREQYESYERKVLGLSRQMGIRRQDLRLKPAELAALLDLKKLERMRDGYLYELKNLSHHVFRGEDRTDVFDRYVSDIFHEISILKEEHYNVQTYAPLYERDAEEVELRHILDEAHTLFPEKLRHTRYLFGRALTRIEGRLPSFKSSPLFLRSLYLHRGDFVAEVYPDGLHQFYRLMYDGGPTEGYYEVGLSFYHSGFFREARESFEAAEAAYLAEVTSRAARTQEDRRRLREILSRLRSKLARLATDAEEPRGLGLTGSALA